MRDNMGATRPMFRCESARRVAAPLIAALALATGGTPAVAQTPAADACATATPLPVPAKTAPDWRAIRTPSTKLSVQVVNRFDTRERGLMCIRSLPARTGMIFVFDTDAPRGFWMKNTLIPLDMIWVHKDGVVDTVAANVPSTTVTTPDDAVPRRSGTGTYVIELGAGEAARAHIRRGVRLVFQTPIPAQVD